MNGAGSTASARAQRAATSARRHLLNALNELELIERAEYARLWPCRTMDSCDPEDDVRDALAHLSVLVRPLVQTSPSRAVRPEAAGRLGGVDGWRHLCRSAGSWGIVDGYTRSVWASASRSTGSRG